jgi:hypothetical protein
VAVTSYVRLSSLSGRHFFQERIYFQAKIGIFLSLSLPASNDPLSHPKRKLRDPQIDDVAAFLGKILFVGLDR